MSPFHPRGDKNSRQEISRRREYVYRLALRGYSLDMILEGLRKKGEAISRATLKRDISAVHEDLLRTRGLNELYSLARAIHELEEVRRETWQQYARPQVEIPRKDGQPIKVDDRMIKVAILKQATDVVVQKARLCGFYSPKILEQMILLETREGRALQHTKISIQEEVDLQVARLKGDREFARSQGLDPDDPTGAGSS